MSAPLEYAQDLHRVLLRVAEGDQPQYLTDQLSEILLTLRAKGLVIWDQGIYGLTTQGHGYLDTWDRWHPEILFEGDDSSAA